MSALPKPVALAEVLARGDIWRGDALATLPADAIPSGYPELDAELPGGGWPRGSLTEFLADQSGFGELNLLLPALASLSREGGWLALVAPPYLPYAPAWSAAGVALERLVVIQPGKMIDWSLEQLLASSGFAGIIAWPGAINERSLRRLQVAAEGRPVFAGLWRSTAHAAAASPAPLRVALSAESVPGKTMRSAFKAGLASAAEAALAETCAGEGRVSLRILKRRGRPASQPLSLPVARPGRSCRALAGDTLSPPAARNAALAIVA